MSNSVGWLLTFNGPSNITLGAPWPSARLYSSAGFPPFNQIESMIGGLTHPLLHVRFAPNTGWIVICANNNYATDPGKNFPQDALGVINAGTTATPQLVLDDIFFTPNNDWLIKWKKSDGTRQYAQSNNFPNDILDIVNEKDQNGQGSELLCLAFPPPQAPLTPATPNGLQATVWSSCIVVCDNNEWQPFNSPPSDITSALANLVSGGGLLRSIVYSSPTSWLVTMANNGIWGHNFDAWIFEQIGQVLASNNQLTLADVVIEAPVREFTLQIVSINPKQVRAGSLGRDTLLGECSISVQDFGTTNPVSTTTKFAFGNFISHGWLIGLGGAAPGVGEAGSSLPAGPPPQYAMSVGPVQITDPRASVVFSYAFANQGSGGWDQLDSTMQALVKGGIGLASAAISALASFIGTPALGSITSGIINAVTGFAFSNCDGLVALDTITMSGATLMALDCQTQSGTLATQTQEYSNQTFPDSLTGKSPYDTGSGSLCGAPDYVITWTILETDSENTVEFANPSAFKPPPFGTSLSVPFNPTGYGHWPSGQPINGTDTTPEPLAACVFLNQMYLFWKANDKSNYIYFTSSPDGRSWPSGQVINNADNTPGPLAACVFTNSTPQNQMYLFWKAGDGSNQIYYSICTDGLTWTPGKLINSGDNTPAALAAIGFQNQLYLFWKAGDGSNKIYYSAYNGWTDGFGDPIPPGGGAYPWPPGQPINGTDSTSDAPAVCLFQNQLYLFWKANDSSNRIFFSASSDGHTWPAGKPINSSDSTAAAVAACVFQTQLYLFWQTNDPTLGTRIFFTVSADGQSWPNGEPINSIDNTSEAVAACVFQNYISLFWKANDASNGIFTSISQNSICMGSSRMVTS
jgi:hypothetical protein